MALSWQLPVRDFPSSGVLGRAPQVELFNMAAQVELLHLKGEHGNPKEGRHDKAALGGAAEEAARALGSDDGAVRLCH